MSAKSSTRKSSVAPLNSPAPTTNHPNTRSTRSASMPPATPANQTSTAASRLRANRKDRVMDSIQSNANKIEAMLNDAPASGQGNKKTQAEGMKGNPPKPINCSPFSTEIQSEGDEDPLPPPPQIGQTDPIIDDFGGCKVIKGGPI
ncbi:hypothetical protein BDZ89DRAFT_74576 [Hymenopellis radicata]|nr:hypothetical protein BDZ89DRAFT_74576 [Hymenopellis radicata]